MEPGKNGAGIVQKGWAGAVRRRASCRGEMADMAIYVVTHKDCDIQKRDGYRTIQAGAAGGRVRADLFDDSGDSISEKNPSYCELTAMYWIWKNTQDPYVGICHYRRFFSRSWNTHDVLDSRDAQMLLQHYQIILPQTAYLGMTPAKEYIRNCGQAEDLLLLEQAIREVCPEYLPAYRRYMSGTTTCWKNMMICSRPLYDQYCSWLFPLLAAMETKIDADSREGSQRRVFGYLAERLLNVWVRYQGLSCCHLFLLETIDEPLPLETYHRCARVLAWQKASHAARRGIRQGGH